MLCGYVIVSLTCRLMLCYVIVGFTCRPMLCGYVIGFACRPMLCCNGIVGFNCETLLRLSYCGVFVKLFVFLSLRGT